MDNNFNINNGNILSDNIPNEPKENIVTNNVELDKVGLFEDKPNINNVEVQPQVNQVPTPPVAPMPQWNNQAPLNSVPTPPVAPMPQWNNQAPVNTVPTPPVAPMPQWNNQAPVNTVPTPPVAPMPQWNNQAPVNTVPTPPVAPMPQWNNQAPVNTVPTPPVAPMPQWNNQAPVNSVPTPPVAPMPQWNNQAPVNTVPTPPVAPMPQWNNQAPVNTVPTPPVAPMPQWNNQAPVNTVPTPPVAPMPQWNNQAPVNTVPTPPVAPMPQNSQFSESFVNGAKATPVNENPANQQQATSTNNVYGIGYQQNDNQKLPHIEYVPYIPGTPLPNGVVPQFINGGWYYPITIKGKRVKKNKKKMKTSVKVFMGVVIGVTLVCIGLFFGWLSTFDINQTVKDNLFNFDSVTSEAEEDDEDQIGLLANPNGPEIELNSSITKDGSTEKAYEVLSESVVSISVFNDDEDPSNGVPKSEGTGIIISEDGYIATNSHVILDDIGSNVWITTKSGQLYKVGVVGNDVRTDLAVLLCEEAQNWKPADFANSDELKVGQDVVAIGSPGGSSYSNSLTRGIVSALDRPLSGTAVTYIQTDAAINPGNSGGPLANMNGQVIGINTIKVVDTQYEGMGFAIPSTKIKEVVDEIIKNGYVTGRARLGVMVTEFSGSTAKYYEAEPGVKIAEIDKESSLYDSDVKEGDIITAIDGKPVTSLMSLYDVLDAYKEGDTVELTIYRINKKNTDKNEEFKVDVELLGD